MLKYKNYTGMVEYDSDGKIFTGEVLGLRDVITFEGRSPEELEESFCQSVDLYLEMCANDGVEPQKPFSGRFNLRIDPELHRRVAERAALAGESLNGWIAEVLRDVVLR
jgi:predicted HicB family RNase H-like nuclease